MGLEILRRSARALLLAVAGLFLYTAPASAQTGTLTGVVVDAETGETLIGVNVVLEGTTTGSATDIEGRYEIRDVPVGTYNLVFSYIGYTPKTVQGVEVTADKPTRIDVSLGTEAVGLDELVVEAEAARNTEAALLRSRQRALAVSDAISAEAISRSGSSDAADAMEKVTGASVVGGKYVYVRGLGERYALTQLNGVSLPSADPDKKAVQFDLFPSGLLDNIVTMKTFTPDKPGSFTGGLVDINTKSFPEQLDLNLSLSTQVNSQTHFGSNVLTFASGNLGFWGLDATTMQVPVPLQDPDVVVPNDVSARIEAQQGNTAPAAMLDEMSKSFNGVMAPSIGTSPIDQRYSFSAGNQSNVLGKPLGYLLSLNYNRSSSSYDDGFTGRYSLSDLNATELIPELLLQDAESSSEVNAGGLLNLAYKFTPEHQLTVNGMYTHSGESRTRFQEGSWPKEFSRSDSTTRFQNRVLHYTERDLYSVQLQGKHFFPGLLDATVEWKAAGAETTQEEPDLRFFASLRRIVQGDTVYAARHSGFADPSRYYRDLDEGSRDAGLDVSVPFRQWSDLSGNFKFGGAFNRIDRDFSERIYSIKPSLPYDNDPDVYFSDANMGVVDVDTLTGDRYRVTFGNVVVDGSKRRNNYTGDQNIGAAYGMVELPFTRKLKMIGGARFETTRMEVVSQDPTQDIGRLETNDLLPSLNLIYQVREDMNVRAAATRTLARPTIREIAPFESFEFINGSFFIGNPNLERTLITNLDFRWEWFVRPGEILAVSTFYKYLRNPIERAILGGTNGQTQYQNVERGSVLGAEIEARKNLDVLGAPLRYFSLGLNLSLAHSSIDIPETELAVRQAIDPNASATRELQGQSPYLLNADLSYENFEAGTTAGLFFNVFGERLARVSKGGTPDVYERSRPLLDFVFSQRIFDSWQFKVSAKNILDSAYEESYEFLGEDFIYQRYKLGRSFSLGVTYSL